MAAPFLVLARKSGPKKTCRRIFADVTTYTTQINHSADLCGARGVRRYEC